MSFQHVAIIGLGLLGGSIGLAVEEGKRFDIWATGENATYRLLGFGVSNLPPPGCGPDAVHVEDWEREGVVGRERDGVACTAAAVGGSQMDGTF